MSCSDLGNVLFGPKHQPAQMRWPRLVNHSDVTAVLSVQYQHSPLLPASKEPQFNPYYAKSAQDWFNQLPDDAAKSIVNMRRAMLHTQTVQAMPKAKPVRPASPPPPSVLDIMSEARKAQQGYQFHKAVEELRAALGIPSAGAPGGGFLSETAYVNPNNGMTLQQQQLHQAQMLLSAAKPGSTQIPNNQRPQSVHVECVDWCGAVCLPNRNGNTNQGATGVGRTGPTIVGYPLPNPGQPMPPPGMTHVPTAPETATQSGHMGQHRLNVYDPPRNYAGDGPQAGSTHWIEDMSAFSGFNYKWNKFDNMPQNTQQHAVGHQPVMQQAVMHTTTTIQGANMPAYQMQGPMGPPVPQSGQQHPPTQPYVTPGYQGQYMQPQQQYVNAATYQQSPMQAYPQDEQGVQRPQAQQPRVQFQENPSVLLHADPTFASSSSYGLAREAASAAGSVASRTTSVYGLEREGLPSKAASKAGSVYGLENEGTPSKASSRATSVYGLEREAVPSQAASRAASAYGLDQEGLPSKAASRATSAYGLEQENTPSKSASRATSAYGLGQEAVSSNATSRAASQFGLDSEGPVAKPAVSSSAKSQNFGLTNELEGSPRTGVSPTTSTGGSALTTPATSGMRKSSNLAPVGGALQPPVTGIVLGTEMPSASLPSPLKSSSPQTSIAGPKALPRVAQSYDDDDDEDYASQRSAMKAKSNAATAAGSAGSKAGMLRVSGGNEPRGLVSADAFKQISSKGGLRDDDDDEMDTVVLPIHSKLGSKLLAGEASSKLPAAGSGAKPSFGLDSEDALNSKTNVASSKLGTGPEATHSKAAAAVSGATSKSLGALPKPKPSFGLDEEDF